MKVSYLELNVKDSREAAWMFPFPARASTSAWRDRAVFPVVSLPISSDPIRFFDNFCRC